MLKKHPEMFDRSNKMLIKASKSPFVNKQWIKYNPTHQSYLGEKLVHHHINNEGFATGIPEAVHKAFYDLLHQF